MRSISTARPPISRRSGRDEALPIPASLDYARMPGLSAELQGRLAAVRPQTLGQAGRIEGITPAALTLVAGHARPRGMSGADRATAIALAGIPPAAVAKLDIYEVLLRKWQRTINLVAPSTLEKLWTRHFADSWQLADAAPAARRWVDMGAGAGFPGLVLAIRLADTPGAHVDLIESDQRKAAFLRDVSRETRAPATVVCGRIEAVAATLAQPDAVTARALAPLSQLLGYAENWLAQGAIGVFPKGQDIAAELTDSPISGKFTVKMRPSLTDPAARIVVLHRTLEA